MLCNRGTKLSTAVHQTLFPRSGDVIHPQLWESGSGHETRGGGGGGGLARTQTQMYVMMIKNVETLYCFETGVMFIITVRND